MKKIVLLLPLIVLLTSCRTDVYINAEPDNTYGVIFKNDTDGLIYIHCKQLVIGSPKLQSGESSEPIYGPTPKVTVNYFGEGTYFKEISEDIVLERNKVVSVTLTYP